MQQIFDKVIGQQNLDTYTLGLVVFAGQLVSGFARCGSYIFIC